jgi:ribosomal protein L40E
MNERALVEVYRARNSPQALALQQVLQEAGLRATIDNDLLQGVVGSLPMGWPTAPRIMVESKDAPRAREILERSEGAETTGPAGTDEASDRTVCLSCGARMPDEADECPACGWSYTSAAKESEGSD